MFNTIVKGKASTNYVAPSYWSYISYYFTYRLSISAMQT